MPIYLLLERLINLLARHLFFLGMSCLTPFLLFESRYVVSDTVFSYRWHEQTCKESKKPFKGPESMLPYMISVGIILIL